MEDNEEFLEYSKRQIHFFDNTIHFLLEKILKKCDNFNIIDLGCGDGSTLRSLEQKDLLKKANKILGVDLSSIRIKRFEKNVKNAIGINADACNTKLDDKFDIVICSQVIEHVPDDTKLVKEIIRLSNANGIIYISSIVKKSYGFYIYRINGEFRLDPTHVREYASKEEFIEMLDRNGLNVIEYSIEQTNYSVLDLIVRLLTRINLIDQPKFDFMSIPLIRILRKIKIPIIGYYWINILAEVKE